MGIRALKATPTYAAFRRWRTRLRERLRWLWRRVDAWTGARRLQRATLQALVESDAQQLLALAELVERVRALEAALGAGRSLVQRPPPTAAGDGATRPG